MSFELFNTNAEICSKMAAGAQSNEIREQWKELAAHWRSKAHACKKSHGPASENERVKQLEVGPSTSPQPVNLPLVMGIERTARKPRLAEARALPSVAPALTPHDEQAALGEIWQALQPKKPAPFASPQ